MTTTPSSSFELTTPLEVGSALKELLHGTRTLLVTCAGVHLEVQLLNVDTRTGSFRFRPFGGEHNMGVLMLASTLGFEGSSYSAQMRFTVNGLRLVTPQDEAELEGPVLEARLPARLHRVQRREHFRVQTALPYARFARWRVETRQTLALRIQDVSIAGVGLRAPAATPGLPDVGVLMKEVELDFGTPGKLSADIEVVVSYPIREFHFQLGAQDHLHFGCRFTRPDRQREHFLQRVVTALERTGRVRG